MAELRPPRRVAVIFNPVSAGERVEERKHELVEALTAAGAVEVTVEETSKDDPGRNAAERAMAQGVDVVVAAGGDGTVMSCVSALAGSPTPLAVLPSGTGNLLANNLDLPGDPEAAAEVALHGPEPGWLRLAFRVLLRRGRRGGGGPPLELFRAVRVELDCSRPQPIQRDGDPSAPRSHFAAEILPGALTLCVPEPAEASSQEGVAS